MGIGEALLQSNMFHARESSFGGVLTQWIGGGFQLLGPLLLEWLTLIPA